MLKGLAEKIDEGWSLLLPLAAIVETGNHISHAARGGMRRAAAQRFTEQVRMAMEGSAPWVVSPIPTNQDWLMWLDEFPDMAMRGIGIGDLAIIKEFEKQCLLNPKRRVMIWTLDKDMKGYDRKP